MKSPRCGHPGGSFVEGCALNQCALLVDQVKVEELATAPRILPGANRSLFDNARLNHPVGRELVQRFDGHVGARGPRLCLGWRG